MILEMASGVSNRLLFVIRSSQNTRAVLSKHAVMVGEFQIEREVTASCSGIRTRPSASRGMFELTL